MTREHKLALILGFALVLVVGVLLSDHLSGARQATLESILDDTTVAEAPLLAPGSPIPSTAPSQQLAANTRAGDEGSTSAFNDDGSSPEPEETLALSTPTDPVPQTLPGQTLDEELELADRPEGRTATLSPEELRRYAQEQFGINLTPVQPRVLGNIAEPTPRSTSGASRSAAATGEPPASRGPSYPAPKAHTVLKDETLWSIAQQHYSDGSLHGRLAAYNRSRLPNPSALRVGLTLLIPSKDELTRSSDATLASRGADAEAAVATPTGNQPANAEQREYVVQRGDTLGEISMETLGTSRRWREIYELNADRIDDPDNVRAGTRLRIPPK